MSEIDVEFFNLTNFIALKLHEFEHDKKIYFFFINIHTGKSLKIECIEFNSSNQIATKIYTLLQECFIFSRLDQESIILENIFIRKNRANQGKITSLSYKKNGFHLIYFKYINKESSLCTNLFSTIELRNYSDQEDVITSMVEEDFALSLPIY